MSQALSMQFSTAPGTIGQYARALVARGNNTHNNELPPLEALLVNVKASASDVKAYARVCGFDPNAEHLPLTYPHILAFPLHMELMLHKAFPYPVMGLVHISNTITQMRHIRKDETLCVRCLLGEARSTDKGIEFDIVTQISSGGEIIWTSVSTNLFRQSSTGSKGPRAVREAASFAHKESWSLPSSLGRQYARVSGDSNPIHLYPLSARLFGFKRHIAHGMWSKARIAAALAGRFRDGCCELTTEFKLPVFLPAKVDLCFSDMNADGMSFELRNATGEKTHVRGRITRPD